MKAELSRRFLKQLAAKLELALLVKEPDATYPSN